MSGTDFKLYDDVIVSACANGYGIDIPGYIDKIEHILGTTLYSITYYTTDPAGGRGICVANPYLIRHSSKSK